MNVTARMKCRFVTRFEQSQSIELEAVYSADPNDPNYSFSKATPSGHLKLTITNPSVFEVFEPGKVYDIVIAEKPEPADLSDAGVA